MRFQPGNPGGVKGKAGRRTRAEEWGVQVTLDRYWKVRDRKEVIVKLVDLAKAGNLDATKILLAYLWGRPPQAIQHSGSLEVGYIESWQDFKDQCQAMGVDPQLARQEAIRLIESSVEDEEDEEES